MTTSDWITLLGAVVAALAIIVSASIALIAVRIQRRQAELERQQAQKDADQDLTEVTQALAHRVAQLYIVPVGGLDYATAQSEITGLVIRANELASESRKVTWYAYYSLALAYEWLWEYEKADANFEKALAKADSQHVQVTILMGKGWLHYSVGSLEDIEKGRACFDKAQQAVGNDASDDLKRDELAPILAQQAVAEFNIGDIGRSAGIFADAWAQCQAITSKWRRNRTSEHVGTIFLRTFGQDQTAMPGAIPADLVAYAASLWQKQNQLASIVQQSTTQTPPLP